MVPNQGKVATGTSAIAMRGDNRKLKKLPFKQMSPNGMAPSFQVGITRVRFPPSARAPRGETTQVGVLSSGPMRALLGDHAPVVERRGVSLQNSFTRVQILPGARPKASKANGEWETVN